MWLVVVDSVVMKLRRWLTVLAKVSDVTHTTAASAARTHPHSRSLAQKGVSALKVSRLVELIALGLGASW